MDSKELFNKLKDNRISFSNGEARKIVEKNKRSKNRWKNSEQEKMVTNLENFYKSRVEVLNFFKDYTKMFFDAIYEAKQKETEQGDTGLKILTPKCFKDY